VVVATEMEIAATSEHVAVLVAVMGEEPAVEKW